MKTTATIDPEKLAPELAYLVKAESRLKDIVKLHYIAGCLYGTFTGDGGESRAKRDYEALGLACEAMDDYCNCYSVRHKPEWVENTCLWEALEDGGWLEEGDMDKQPQRRSGRDASSAIKLAPSFIIKQTKCLNEDELLPTTSQRQGAKTKIMEAVSSRLRSRIDEVFEMADEDEEPMVGARITRRDLSGIREQICGCIAGDLDHDLGEQVQEILEAELTAEREVGGGSAPADG
jgi:hypothetical protein